MFFSFKVRIEGKDTVKEKFSIPFKLVTLTKVMNAYTMVTSNSLLWIKYWSLSITLHNYMHHL